MSEVKYKAVFMGCNSLCEGCVFREQDCLLFRDEGNLRKLNLPACENGYIYQLDTDTQKITLEQAREKFNKTFNFELKYRNDVFIGYIQALKDHDILEGE